jgi:hypothetical protein
MSDATNHLVIAGPVAVVVGILAIGILAFEIWMFIDVLRNPRLSAGRKLLWAIGMLLLHPFVAIAYYFTARKPKH